MIVMAGVVVGDIAHCGNGLKMFKLKHASDLVNILSAF